MATRAKPPALKAVWRTETVRHEMTVNDIAEGISYIFHSVKPEARTKLLVTLAEIDTKLRAKDA